MELSDEFFTAGHTKDLALKGCSSMSSPRGSLQVGWPLGKERVSSKGFLFQLEPHNIPCGTKKKIHLLHSNPSRNLGEKHPYSLDGKI